MNFFQKKLKAYYGPEKTFENAIVKVTQVIFNQY